MSQVNLLPPELLSRQKTRRLTSLIVLAGVGALVLLGAFWFLEQRKLSGVNDDVAAQNATNAAVQQQITGLQSFQNLQAEAQAKQQLLAQAFSGEVSFSGILMDLSRVIPSDAYLTSFDAGLAAATSTTTPPVTTGGAPATTLVGSFAAQGQGAGVDTLASWLSRLESVKGWVNPWLTQLGETNAFSRVYNFSSGADLSGDALTTRGRGGSARGG